MDLRHVFHCPTRQRAKRVKTDVDGFGFVYQRAPETRLVFPHSPGSRQTLDGERETPAVGPPTRGTRPRQGRVRQFGSDDRIPRRATDSVSGIRASQEEDRFPRLPRFSRAGSGQSGSHEAATGTEPPTEKRPLTCLMGMARPMPSSPWTSRAPFLPCLSLSLSSLFLDDGVNRLERRRDLRDVVGVELGVGRSLPPPVVADDAVVMASAPFGGVWRSVRLSELNEI